MNESVNLSSMAEDSAAALKKLTRDLKDLRRLIEVRALRHNAQRVSINPADLPDMDPESFRSQTR